MTINEIEKAVIASGSHWFDVDTMAFFGTRVRPVVYEGIGGIFFVTSEKPPESPRRYSVRQYFADTNKISTVGDFCVMNETQAVSLAKRLSVSSPKCETT